MINKLKIGLLLSILSLSVAVAGSAIAADVSYTSNVTTTIDGNSYVIQAGSGATDVTVGATTLTVTVPSGSYFTLTSASQYVLNNSIGLAAQCDSSVSSLRINGPQTAVVITPDATQTCIVGGGGGGGGSSSTPAATTVSTPVVTPVVTATPAVTTATTTTVTVPASSLNAAQVSSIISLLQSFGADEATIANVQASLAGGTVTISGIAPGQVLKLTKTITTKSLKADVKNLQEALNSALGSSLSKPLVVDGKWGKATVAAIKLFQTANGLKGDGVMGPASRAKLNSILGL